VSREKCIIEYKFLISATIRTKSAAMYERGRGTIGGGGESLGNKTEGIYYKLQESNIGI